MHVPYKGSGPLATDLIGGQISMSFDTVTPVLQHIRSGKLRALGVFWLFALTGTTFTIMASIGILVAMLVNVFFVQSSLMSLITSVASIACQAAERPNIILIMADDLGYGEVGFNGQRIHRTPNIDRLASRGTLFRNAHTAGVFCAPSRAATASTARS